MQVYRITLVNATDIYISAGRLKYFYSTTSPLTLLASSDELEKAQKDVTKYEGQIKEGKGKPCLVNEYQRDEYWKAKQRESMAKRMSVP